MKVVSFNGSFPDKPRVSEAYRARLVTFQHSEGPGSLSVVMNVSGVTCRDRGAYICSLVTSDGQQYQGSGDVEIQGILYRVHNKTMTNTIIQTIIVTVIILCP